MNRFVKTGWLAGSLLVLMVAPPTAADDNPVLHDGFDSLENWEAFTGFRGTPPEAKILPNRGRDGSAAVGVTHGESFRADNWGLRRNLPDQIAEGVVWMECWFHPPESWTGGLYFDAMAGRSVVARIAAAFREANEDHPEPAFRAHASWSYSYWRLYSLLPPNSDWHRLTMRLDLEGGTYAAWIDDTILGEEMPLCSREPIDRIHLGFGGAPGDPARIDELTISRSAPPGRNLRTQLPEPKEGLEFRIAVIGDSQVGFTNYEADLIRYRQSIDQMKRADAELLLSMGDMVHDADDEKAYRDVGSTSEALGGPAWFVRGNHDRLDLYQKHFHPKPDFTVTHKGWRFVFLDAIGNQRGLSDEQLAFADRAFGEAADAGEERVLCLHVSPWEDNDKGRGNYNQIGPGRDRLVELLKKHGVLFCLSGHYHRGLWHHEEAGTHYLVFGGTAQVKQGWLGWCLFDIYPDRVEIHQKPVYFAYEREDSAAFYNFNYGTWTAYEEVMEKYPYLQQGPLVIERRKK